MSANGTISIIWANGEDEFCLAKVGYLLDLESKCAAPIGVIFQRLGDGKFSIHDVREVIRLGLIGAGMLPDKAMLAVKVHVDGNPNGLAPSVIIAYEVLKAVMVGVPDDPVGKGMPAEAQKTGSTMKTDASDAPKSSPSAPVLDGHPERRKNRPSGRSSQPSMATTE